MSKPSSVWTTCVDTMSSNVNATACEFQTLARPQTFGDRSHKCASAQQLYLPSHLTSTIVLFLNYHQQYSYICGELVRGCV